MLLLLPRPFLLCRELTRWRTPSGLPTPDCCIPCPLCSARPERWRPRDHEEGGGPHQRCAGGEGGSGVQARAHGGQLQGRDRRAQAGGAGRQGGGRRQGSGRQDTRDGRQQGTLRQGCADPREVCSARRCSFTQLLQGTAVAAGAAAAAEAAEALREKDKKINELIEDLGNKELLLSEAQGQLAAVRAAGWRPAACRLHACSAACSAGCAERKSARCSLKRRGMCLKLRQLESVR